MDIIFNDNGRKNIENLYNSSSPRTLSYIASLRELSVDRRKGWRPEGL